MDRSSVEGKFTWSKVYLVPLLLVLLGQVEATSPLWWWAAPVLAGAPVELGVTAELVTIHDPRFTSDNGARLSEANTSAKCCSL